MAMWLTREIEELLEEILEILKYLRRHHRTTQLAVKFYPSWSEGMADLNLKIGQSSTASIVPLEADGTTVTPGASINIATIVWTLTDASVKTAPNPDGTLTITGEAASAAVVNGTVAATVVDGDGVSTPLTKAFTVLVTAPTGRTTQLGVKFTTPA